MQEPSNSFADKTWYDKIHVWPSLAYTLASALQIGHIVLLKFDQNETQCISSLAEECSRKARPFIWRSSDMGFASGFPRKLLRPCPGKWLQSAGTSARLKNQKNTFLPVT